MGGIEPGGQSPDHQTWPELVHETRSRDELTEVRSLLRLEGLRVAELEAEKVQLSRRVKTIEQARDEAWDGIGKLQSHVAALELELDAEKSNHASTKLELQRVEDTLRDALRSRSWRYTALMRRERLPKKW